MEVGVVMRRRRLALAWVLMLLLSQCTGHIRLTFPPARKYQLDFLDNVRTKGPCGMPPGLDGERTSLEAGSDLEVHWHLAYPHRGGYFFQLLDQNNTVTYRYPAEPDSFLGTQDGTSIKATVPIPDDSCDQCTLRMVRQAREWGGNYLFWSCADVTVQQTVAASDLCSGHGDAQAGQCECDPLYLGDRCQFKDECVVDSDCGPHGRCEDIQATSYPKRQCYCAQGWFGPRCQHQSTVQNKPTDLSGYTTRTLSADSDITVYYRTVQDEVEVIMKARTNSWMALGWRPAGIGRSCQNFPDLGDGYNEGDDDGESVTPETTAEGTPETTAEGTPETTAEGTPETTAEGTPETTAEGTPETTAEGTPETTAEGTPETTAETTAEGTPETTAEGTPETTAETTAEGTPETTAEGTPETTAEGTPETTAEGTPETTAEGTPETTAEGTPETTAEGTPETTAETTAEGTPETTAEGTPETTAEGTPETTAEGTPETTAETTAEGTPETTAEGTPETTAEGTPETTAEGTPETTAEGTPETTAEGTPETTAEGTPETTAEGTPETTAEGTPESTPEGTPEGDSGPPQHAMDCTDIIIGSARGDYSRIGDYYTRDRSTPVWDEYLGGQNSLTAGLVWEEGQHTWMLFRRKLTSNDTADHSLEDETTHVIWAVGQHADADGRYNHWPNSALESGSANITDFYRQDELKYHGHKGQRGATALNFHAVDEPKTDSDNCTQGSCPSSVCGLDFSWTYDSDTDLITFNISASPVSPNQWIALGFSDDHYMANSDVIYGAAGGGPEGDPFVTDGWLFARAPPSKDDQSDAVLVSGQHADGTTTLVFSRPRTTNDSEDLDLSDCRYVFFADNGGEVFPQGITKHTSTPIMSSQKICFGFCQPEVTTGTDATQTDAVTVTTGGDATTSADHRDTTTFEDTIDRPEDIERKVRYKTPASIRLPDEDYTQELSDSTSPYFIREAKIIGSFMFALLHPFLPNKLMDIFVKAFRRGSIIVDVEIETIHDPGAPLRQIQEEVKSAVLSSFHNQTLQGYGVMHVISVSSPVRDEKPDEDDSVLTEVEIIIVVIATALVLLAVLIGVCKYVETRRSAASQNRPKASSRGSASTCSGSDRSSRKETMSYSEFLALEAEAKKEATPPFYSAFDNPAYESVGSPYVP